MGWALFETFESGSLNGADLSVSGVDGSDVRPAEARRARRDKMDESGSERRCLNESCRALVLLKPSSCVDMSVRVGGGERREKKKKKKKKKKRRGRMMGIYTGRGPCSGALMFTRCNGACHGPQIYISCN